MSDSHPSRFRIARYFFFAWAVSAICGVSLTLTGSMFFELDSDVGFSIKIALFGLILAVLQYGSGAFFLGTLNRGRIKTWTCSIIYVIPSFLFRGLIFASTTRNEAIKDELLANAGYMIIMPIIYLAISPFVSFYFIRLGKDSAEGFSRQNAVLNIPWQHYLWILPFYLFQVVGVPSYLLLTLWKIDLLTADIPLSIFSLSALIPRIIIFAILVGIIMSINSMYSTLSEQREGSRIFNGLKVLGNWFLLTGIQVLIVLSYIGRHMD